MKDFVGERWRSILAYNGVVEFEALWAWQMPWFEPPNHRRGGWSGVSRCELKRPEGGYAVLFMKRQENHCARSWAHPIDGEPTFFREFRCLMHYRRSGIPTLEPVYFAARKDGSNHRAILITEALTGYLSLEAWIQSWQTQGVPELRVRRQVLSGLARLLREMHAQGIQHNCFFPKHVFVRVDAEGADVRVIDLEKSRWRPLAVLCALRDLGTLNYYSQAWRRCDRLWFFRQYLGLDRLTPYAKWLCRAVLARSEKKRRSRAMSAAHK